jgi:predicted ATPase
VELFADRASRVDPGFALDGTTGPVIGQLLDRLDDRFTLLTSSARMAPARQRSLAATVDWSHQLLSDQGKQAFRRLAIFSGPFSLDAAETVAGAAAGC